MKSYIDCNTEKRKAESYDFEKDFTKLLSNSVYGKSMENISKRINFRLFNDRRKLKKAIAKPTCEYFIKINEDMAMVQFMRRKITQNKPLYTGFVVLEVSKVLICGFHYTHIQRQYGAERARLLFTDTNSRCCKIQPDDLHHHIFSTTTKVRIQNLIHITVRPMQNS